MLQTIYKLEKHLTNGLKNEAIKVVMCNQVPGLGTGYLVAVTRLSNSI